MTYTVPTPPTPPTADGPLTGPDRELLRGYLGWQRSVLLNICAGLTGEQLARRPFEGSELSLLGLVRHLAKVERIWLQQRAAGSSVPPLHGGAGDPADFRDLDPATAPDAVAQLRAEQEAGDRAVDGLDWDAEIEAYGERWSIRMVHVHLIGEYARHNGHADLLREAIDGVTGR